jgi:molybdopterin-guanine dinucleotide biosynthesis protein A
MPPESAAGVVGVLLAGGQSRRMGGGDKCLREIAGETLLARVFARVRPQVAVLILNAGGDAKRFAAYDAPVVADAIEGFAGPLAGILTGMEWARDNAPACEWIATFPTDAPFLPENLVARLRAALTEEGAELACAASGGRAHPVVGLWPVALGPALRLAIVEEDMRKIDLWTARYRLARVEFRAEPVDPFFNVNAPDDLAAAEAALVSVGRN